MTNISNPADGKYVVIENGQRVTAPMESKPEAEREAAKRNRVAESHGQPLPENRRATVKQNLLG